MLARLGRRLLTGLAVVLGVVTLTFFLLHVAPGDPVERLLGPTATAEQLAAQRTALGLDRPLPLQFAAWLGRFAPSRAECSSHPGSARARKRALLLGAVLLAVLAFLVLLVAGHPWSITWAFALWGAKAALWLGWQPDASAFWNGDFQRRTLEANLLEDVTSVTDIGIIVGAAAAAGIAGRFSPRASFSGASLAAAVIGGLAMGYGARIAYGCNIGAFFSGVASTSLHGWVWIVAALGGNVIGVRLRPWFGLRN